MIEEARAFEHSGPYFALLKWGCGCKQLILFTILAERVPGAVGPGRRPSSRARSCWPSWRCWPRPARVGCVVAVIDNSFAKLRLFKITEFVVGARSCWPCSACSRLYLGGG